MERRLVGSTDKVEVGDTPWLESKSAKEDEPEAEGLPDISCEMAVLLEESELPAVTDVSERDDVAMNPGDV